MGEEIKILFVCRYNRFRSRVAKAYFDKINRNKNIRTRAAGLIKGQPLNKKTVKIVKKIGLDISGKTKGLTSKDLAWQNVTVIVADNVPEQVFDKNKRYGKRVIVWKIKDFQEKNNKSIKKTISQIIKKVDRLVKELEGVKWKK